MDRKSAKATKPVAWEGGQPALLRGNERKPFWPQVTGHSILKIRLGSQYFSSLWQSQKNGDPEVAISGLYRATRA